MCDSTAHHIESVAQIRIRAAANETDGPRTTLLTSALHERQKDTAEETSDPISSSADEMRRDETRYDLRKSLRNTSTLETRRTSENTPVC